MRTVHRLIALLFGITLYLSGTAVWALDIQDIRLGTYPDKIRMVLDMDQSSDFRSFTLADPYRLVIDLPEFQWKAGAVSTKAVPGIQAVRHGNLHAGISRIVFDFNAPLSIINAFVLPKASGKSDRLVIDFQKTNLSSFQKSKSKIFGTLPINTAANLPATSNSAAKSAYKKPQSKPARIPETQKPLVVIDPGHGGADPGAIGIDKNHEKNITLAISKELKRQLLASGKYRVLMTRERDVYIKLRNRVKFARKHGADFFISIHADTIHKSNVKGASVYTLSEKASDAQTAKLAARENRADLIEGIDLSVEDEEVANILVDLAMRDTQNQSNYMANTLVSIFNNNNIKVLERPHRYAGFAVLKAPDIPSILVEAGFLSNRSEAKLLSKPSHRKKIATALKQGIDAYFKTVEDNERQ